LTSWFVVIIVIGQVTLAHIAFLQDACRPQQRLNPDEAVFQRLDILITTAVALAMTDKKQIGKWRCISPYLC
jgi:hypothetical protein